LATLIYSAITSLDGYIEDQTGRFDWAMPDQEVHTFINDLERSVGTYLYGRRMYETMLVWETDTSVAQQSPVTNEYAQIWQAAEKIVFSKTLTRGSTSRTRIERNFSPKVIREMKMSAGRDITVGGAHLASHAFKAGLVDECRLYVSPVIVGGGKVALPREVRLPLELLETRPFGNGMVYLRYRVAG
jgi:dihydrofolate reductase